MTRRNRNIIITILVALITLIVLAFALLVLFTAAPPAENDSASSTTQSSSTEPPSEPGYTVYIETGHGIEDSGNWDPGCSWSDGTTTYEEAKIMIPIARAMADYLTKAGVRVYTDAYEDNNMNLTYTLDFLDSHPEIDAFVNIHCDWEEAESGTMPLYRTKKQRVLAKALNEGVHELVDIPDRGLSCREDLDTLNSEQVHCPSVLFETGSIKADNKTLTTQYDDYGKGLALGMCRYLDIPFNY